MWQACPHLRKRLADEPVAFDGRTAWVGRLYARLLHRVPAHAARASFVRKRTALLAIALVLGCASSRQLRGPRAVEPVSDGAIEFTLLLVGDAGYATSDDPVLAAMSAAAARSPNRTAMVFLGDNLYPSGLAAQGSSDRDRGERVLAAQVDAAASAGVRAIFLPGNHDWDGGGADGWEKVRRAERFLESRGAELLPRGGCPGPSVVDISASLRLIALDTQWWLHRGSKPRHPTSDCPADSETEVLDSLTSALAGAGERQVVVAAHHPLESTGTHGGYYNWKAHIFPLRGIARWLWVPLPVVGSAYPAFRSLFPTDQNLAGSANRHMRAAIDSVLALHPPLIFVSGHEHSLQVMTGDAAKYLLISGAGPSESPSSVGRADRTLFARSAPGFMRIDFLRGGGVRLGVITTDRDGNGVEEYSRWLETEKKVLR